MDINVDDKYKGLLHFASLFGELYVKTQSNFDSVHALRALLIQTKKLYFILILLKYIQDLYEIDIIIFCILIIHSI